MTFYQHIVHKGLRITIAIIKLQMQFNRNTWLFENHISSFSWALGFFQTVCNSSFLLCLPSSISM